MEYLISMYFVKRKPPLFSSAKRFPGMYAIALAFCSCGANAACQDVEQTVRHDPVLQIPLAQGLQAVVIPVRVNDIHTVRCILDTGMPNGLFLFDPNTAAKCKLVFAGVANVRGVGDGSLSASVSTNEKLSIDSLGWSGQQVIALNDPGPLAHLGVDGAIGATVFSDYIVQLDFEQNLVSFFSPKGFDDSRAGNPIPIEVKNTQAFIQAVINLDGKETAVDLLLDTGANKGLSLNPSPAAAFQPPKPVLSTYLGSGVGGEVTGSLGRISSLTLGRHVLIDVATSFPDNVGNAGNGRDRDGTLGMGILNRFLVTIDYPNRRVFLLPNQSFTKPSEFSMTGFSLLPDKSGQLLVHSILEDSPASAAGIRIGDRLVEVNGMAVNFLQYSQLEQQLRTPGEPVDFLFESNGRQVTRTLELKRLR